jgi:zinc/manganese transport system permease protein
VSGFQEMMAAPVVMSLILMTLHVHLGSHVVRRGVIFVDIALAQVAAFGVAVAMLLGGEIGGDRTSMVAFASVMVGAWLISRTRTREKKVPQEAYIGIIYVVFSAAMILLLTQVPHGGEEVHNLLVGSILWVEWGTVLRVGVLYAILGVILWRWRDKFSLISDDPEAARNKGLKLKRWDFGFYLILGLVVTASVQIAGVLMVFTLLVVPTVMGLRLWVTERAQFIYAQVVGVVAVVGGAGLSYGLDLPTGAAIVCVFGFLLILQILLAGRKSSQV